MAKKPAPKKSDPIYNYGWVTDELIEEFNKNGFTDPNTQKALLRQMLAEGGPTMAKREKYNGTPEEYFGKMYGPDTKAGKSLGNKSVEDAMNFRGRGYIHLTGRANYERLAKLTGLDIVNKPELAEQEDNARLIMYEYLKDKAKAMKLDLTNEEHLHRAIAPRESWQQRQNRVLPISDIDYGVHIPVPPNPNPPPASQSAGRSPSGTRMTLEQFRREQSGGITPDTTPPAR